MFRYNLGLKISAVLLACFFWLQSVLLKEQQTVVRLPLVVINQSDQVTLKDLPTSVPYRFKGPGFEILKLKLFHVTAELDAMELKKGANEVSALDYRLNLPSSVRLEVLGTETGTANAITTEYVKTVSLPVEIDFETPETRARFYEKNFHLIPDHIEVRGSVSALKNMQYIKTQPLKSESLTKVRFKLKVVAPPSLTLNTNTVDISQSETKLITKVLWKIPIQTETGITIFPTTITIQVRGQNEAIKTLTPQQINVRLNTGQASNGQIPLIVEIPSGIELIDYTPQKVTRSN